jgi:hypothetical protein
MLFALASAYELHHGEKPARDSIQNLYAADRFESLRLFCSFLLACAVAGFLQLPASGAKWRCQPLLDFDLMVFGRMRSARLVPRPCVFWDKTSVLVD